ncbi:MAG: acyloxyacyl hydrolase [Acidobacteria bacterium]|nr:MAG: acyloxyacyl hydrolase [Acidobacteriota bacterium]
MRRPMPRTSPVAAAAVLWLLVAAAVPVQADEVRSLALSGGVFRVNKPDKQVEVGAELRLPTQTWKLVVATGLYYAAEGSFYGFGGLRRDFSLGGRWQVTPGFGVALYEQGSGKDLGGLVEFRTMLEVSHQWPKGNRLGAAFYHLSNAGLYDHNPGSNSVIVTYSFPVWQK